MNPHVSLTPMFATAWPGNHSDHERRRIVVGSEQTKQTSLFTVASSLMISSLMIRGLLRLLLRLKLWDLSEHKASFELQSAKQISSLRLLSVTSHLQIYLRSGGFFNGGICWIGAITGVPPEIHSSTRSIESNKTRTYACQGGS